MARRYPEAWLMTDERMGDSLWAALRRLPPGSGIVFRYHATPAPERRALHRRVRRIAQARRLMLLNSRAPGMPGDGTHGPGRGHGMRSHAAHDRRQAIAGVRAGAAVLFVSPVFATRSHPGAAAIGPMRAAAIGCGLVAAVIALGGMNARRYRRIRRLGFDGWAAIDAWTDQKRNAVPT